MGSNSLQVAIHDMGNADNAQTIFNYDLPVSRIQIQGQTQAVVDTGLGIAYRSQAIDGQYYVEAIIDDSSDVALASLEVFTLRILQRIGDPAHAQAH